jgi:signal transduction histidine kinase
VSLRLKILLAFLGVIASMASLGYLGLENLSLSRRAEAELRQINNQRIFLQRAWAEVDSVLYLADRLRFEARAPEHAEFHARAQDLVRSLDDLQNSGLDVEGRARILALRREILTLREHVDRFVSASRNSKKGTGSEEGGISARVRSARQVQQVLGGFFDERFIAVNLSTSRRLQWSYIWFFAAICLAVLLASAFGFVVQRTILGPVVELRAAAEQIRAGHLEVTLDTSGKDELSEVSRAFVEMSLALQERFREERRLMQELNGAGKRLAKEKQDIESLVEIGNATSSSLDLMRVLAILTDRASEMIRCYRCSVFQLDSESPGGLSVLSSVLYLKGGPMPVHIDRYPEIRAVAETRETIQIDDVATHPLLREVSAAVLGAGLSSILAIPMLHQGRLQGVLSFLRDSSRGGPFSEWERRLGEMIAGIGAVRIENAKLYSSMQESRDRVESLNATLSKTVDELRTTRDRLVASERMAAVGEAAASIAHSFRNPLAAVRASAQARLGNGGPDDSLREIIKLVDRMERYLDQILNFSRSGKEARSRLDPNESVRGIADILAPRAADLRVTLIPRYGQDIPPVVANPEGFERAILALVENAIEASTPGGTVELRTLREGVGDLRIEVQDHGEGIPDEVLPRIFDPFFSTKINGTGLGATLARKVIQSMSGTIEVSRPQDGGTLFVLRIPGSPA